MVPGDTMIGTSNHAAFLRITWVLFDNIYKHKLQLYLIAVSVSTPTTSLPIPEMFGYFQPTPDFSPSSWLLNWNFYVLHQHLSGLLEGRGGEPRVQSSMLN